MDRDQVNLLHCLYQGNPAQHLTQDMLYHPGGQAPLIWCGPDTVSPLLNSGILREDNGMLCMPEWCLSLIDQVENQIRTLPQPDFAFGYPFSKSIRRADDPRPAFLAISYASAFDRVKACVLNAASAAKFQCEVTGDLSSPGNIMDQVWQGIRGADVIVADVTGNNPNVMIEVEMAAALGKEVIVISQNDVLPFDIRHWRKIHYDVSDLQALEAGLMSAFRAVSARYPFEGPEPRF